MPFPVFDPGSETHRSLAELGARAEKVAAGVELSEGIGFQKARRLVRDALNSNGVAREIEELVRDLLAPVAVVSL